MERLESERDLSLSSRGWRSAPRDLHNCNHAFLYRRVTRIFATPNLACLDRHLLPLQPRSEFVAQLRR
jgi:hypothetical protein